MAPLFSKVDLNKLWHDVQNEETLIYAKFGKNLFNISKVIGHKKSGTVFFDSQRSMTASLRSPPVLQREAVKCMLSHCRVG